MDTDVVKDLLSYTNKYLGHQYMQINVVEAKLLLKAVVSPNDDS